MNQESPGRNIKKMTILKLLRNRTKWSQHFIRCKAWGQVDMRMAFILRGWLTVWTIVLFTKSDSSGKRERENEIKNKIIGV